MEAQKKVTNLIQFFNQNGPIKAKPLVPKSGPKNEETDVSDRDNSSDQSEEEIPERARRDDDDDDSEEDSNADDDGYCPSNPPILSRSRSVKEDETDNDSFNDGARRVDDSEEDSNDDSEEDSNADDDSYCPPNPPILSRSRSVKQDETNNDSSNEDEEKPTEEYHHYEEVIYEKQKEIKNVRPPPRRNMKGKILFRTNKYPDKIEEIQAKATATLETFKNNPLTEAAYHSYKKLLMQTRGELKVMKPKNKKQRNKLEHAVQFTECVMKELDDEFTKYMTSIRSKNK